MYTSVYMKPLLARLTLLTVLLIAFVFFIFSRSDEPEIEPFISYTNASEDLIMVTSPALNEKISSPLAISGKARGPWYFEATAPVLLVDWDGRIIAESYITAQDNPSTELETGWMTEDFVPFTGTLEFPVPSLYPRGALIFRNSNPSGLPENDRAVDIPIRF
ncbi:MAG: hypothetical protein UY82_C0046G0011 [Candidatus Uhrbacteria bacterium GW2011_GWC2_53_7]|uniref:Bacterial spore germination immunoglobulin-like domain-containing protein n=1 Tax=Candidatus Uhrbacteria bacterium GW2011_GWC2_53_7 TaxID=1618986 RepID=A0A0G2AR28_9BACT|nr:MAG: hypothetical protein UY82_C0046G0011 [Candidatus Uhrbacteria bacterium GW2011_GWC2_53_7]